jgi:hypothetical protein
MNSFAVKRSLTHGAMQGNCGASSNVRLLQDLETSTSGRVEYPPLKPFQCVLVIDKPFLLNYNATLWLDSLYVAISRTRAMSEFAVIQHGNYIFPETAEGRNSMYITSSTFVGEGRGNAWAIASHASHSSHLIEGTCCYFFDMQAQRLG